MYKHNSNHIFFIGDDFYEIEVSIRAGTGRRKLAGVYYVAVQEQILELIDREWNSVIPDYDRLDYDFDVKITGLYGVSGNQRLAFPIMLLMRTILEGRTIKDKTAICEMLDVQDEPIYDTKENALRILRLAELQKIDTIIAITHDDAKVAGCFPIENEKVIICSSFTDAINELSEEDFLKDVGYYV